MSINNFFGLQLSTGTKTSDDPRKVLLLKWENYGFSSELQNIQFTDLVYIIQNIHQIAVLYDI